MLAQKRETRLYIRLAKAEKDQLQLLANTHKSTLSEAARDAIREYLAKYAQTATMICGSIATLI